jgi:beta-xylosidase
MNRSAVASLLALAAGAATLSAQTFENPVLAGDYPDPSVIRVGKDYWATATSSEWAPQFPLMHSTDLVNWKVVGSVFDKQPSWSVGNYWAPEIAEYKGRYFIYYVGRKQGGPLSIAVAASDKPEGPYRDHGILVSQPAGSIDAVTAVDENGELYMLWKEDGNSRKLPCIIWAQRLSDDGTKLLGEPRELFRNDTPWEGAVIEGPFVVKRGDWFYLFYSGNACCGSNCDYALGVARSKALLGPWKKNPKNPILAGNSEWRCPGHGSIVDDPQGRYWLMYHAYDAASFVFTGREALLDEVVFGADGWPTINDGKGPSGKHPAPFNVAQRKSELTYKDDFDASVPGWNWFVGDQNPATLKNGKLLLHAGAKHGTNLLAAAYGRSITGGDLVAVTVLELASVDSAESAGLAMIGDRSHATGIAVSDGKMFVWNRKAGQQDILASTSAPAGPKLFLKVRAENGGEYDFSYSADGRNWKELRSDVSGKHLPPWDRAVRVAMTVGGKPNADAEFDSFIIEAKRSDK